MTKLNNTFVAVTSGIAALTLFWAASALESTPPAPPATVSHCPQEKLDEMYEAGYREGYNHGWQDQWNSRNSAVGRRLDHLTDIVENRLIYDAPTEGDGE